MRLRYHLREAVMSEDQRFRSIVKGTTSRNLTSTASAAREARPLQADVMPPVESGAPA
jgi:hypothetical protein